MMTPETIAGVRAALLPAAALLAGNRPREQTAIRATMEAARSATRAAAGDICVGSDLVAARLVDRTLIAGFLFQTKGGGSHKRFLVLASDTTTPTLDLGISEQFDPPVEIGLLHLVGARVVEREYLRLSALFVDPPNDANFKTLVRRQIKGLQSGRPPRAGAMTALRLPDRDPPQFMIEGKGLPKAVAAQHLGSGSYLLAMSDNSTGKVPQGLQSLADFTTSLGLT